MQSEALELFSDLPEESRLREEAGVQGDGQGLKAQAIETVARGGALVGLAVEFPSPLGSARFVGASSCVGVEALAID
eukprot:3022547-Amphidinium_carterae.1